MPVVAGKARDRRRKNKKKRHVMDQIKNPKIGGVTMPLINPGSILGRILNAILDILVALKNAAVFKRGSSPGDLQPGVKDPRDKYKQ